MTLRSRDVGGTNIDIRGLHEAIAALKRLEGPEVKKVLQKASTAGARTIKPFVKAETPRGKTKRLYKSISATQARRDKPAAIVKFRPKIAFYRHMVIRGTKPHRIRFPNQKADGVPKREGNIRHPGAKDNPILTRAWSKGQTETLAAVNKVIHDYLESI